MALDVITSISLDMQNPYSTTDMVHVNQYDSGLRVKAVLLNAGQKWEVPSGAKAVVAFKKSDNIGGFYDATDDDPSVQAVNIDNDRSVIYISLDAQTTTTPTTVNKYVDMQVVFYQNGKRLSTFAFYMDVRPSVVTSKDVTSSWMFKILSQEIADTLTVATTPAAMTEWLEANIMQETGYVIDNTLTVAGAASDAQATGKMVTVSDQNPNTIANKVWVKKTPAKIQIPTVEELDELKNALGKNIKIIAGSFSNSVWRSSYYSIFIKVTPGSSYTFTREGTETTSSYIGLRSINTPPVEGDVADYSKATGWSKVRTLNNHETETGVIPDDVNWLYFYAGATLNTLTRLPTAIIINGINLFDTAFDDIISLGNIIKNNKTELDENVHDINKEIDLLSRKVDDLNLNLILDNYHEGLYIASGKWQFLNPPNVAGVVIIPVHGGEKIYAQTGSRSAYIGALREYNPIEGERAVFSSTNFWASNIVLEPNTSFTNELPNDAHFLYLYAGINRAFDRLPTELTLDGLSIYLSAREHININRTPTKIRVMQYNIGGYNYGDKTAPGITVDAYDEKLVNYKKMLCKYQPDIIGIEEFREYIDREETHRADDVLFDYLFPYSVWYEEHQRNLKSKAPILYKETGLIQGTIENYARYSYAKILINGRIVSVLCTALTSGATAEALEKRTQILPLLINKLSNDEYAIILLDANNSGNAQGIRSYDELDNMVSFLKSSGWDACNGSFLPWKETCTSRLNPNVRPPIDNIFFKNNGKIIFNNFESLADEYENLSSDHYPVYADFTLI